MRFTLIRKLLSRNKDDDKKVDVRTLVKFLRKNKIRRIFISNFNKYPLNLRYENIAELCNDDTAPIDWIRLAFRWNATKEGKEYWENISNEWIQYLVDNEDLKEII